MLAKATSLQVACTIVKHGSGSSNQNFNATPDFVALARTATTVAVGEVQSSLYSILAGPAAKPPPGSNSIDKVKDGHKRVWVMAMQAL